jgi:cytochrome c556
MRVKQVWVGLAVLGAIGLGTGAAVAQDGVYKERETLMKGFGQRMNVIKGVVAENKGTLPEAATAAQEIAGSAEKIPAVFPDGTNAGESEALPVIWQQWGEFEGKARTMEELAAQLATAAGSGDQAATLAAFANLGRNGCGGCHETFREKSS